MRVPELIGDPRDNEGWRAGKAGGLIGPGSGQAFVWDMAQPVGWRIPQAALGLATRAQRSTGVAIPGRVCVCVCKAENQGAGGFSKLLCRI